MRFWTLIALIALLLLGCHRRRRAQEPTTLPAASSRANAGPTAPYGQSGGAEAALASSPGKQPRPPAGQVAAPLNEAAWVDAHNRVRAKHCAPPLEWSPKLAQVAQQWANTLRDKGCVFGHSGNATYGENLAAATTGSLDAAAIVKMWYDEIADYKFPDGGFSMKTGHFTQVVWRGTSRIGCGRSLCKTMEIWVCEYERPGNWEGQYRANVLPLGCK
jgi:uncharacterized protein YkwD